VVLHSYGVITYCALLVDSVTFFFGMRTLLRHTGTGLYFQGPNNWTNSLQLAYDFRFIERAVRFAQTWELREVELAFAFDDPECLTTASLEVSSLRIAA
jgi:hypothetical protein